MARLTGSLGRAMRKDTYAEDTYGAQGHLWAGESAIRRGRLACTLPPSQRNGWFFAGKSTRFRPIGAASHNASNGPSHQPIFTSGSRVAQLSPRQRPADKRPAAIC
jgi:hypothetical protein